MTRQTSACYLLLCQWCTCRALFSLLHPFSSFNSLPSPLAFLLNHCTHKRTPLWFSSLSHSVCPFLPNVIIDAREDRWAIASDWSKRKGEIMWSTWAYVPGQCSCLRVFVSLHMFYCMNLSHKYLLNIHERWRESTLSTSRSVTSGSWSSDPRGA